MGWGVGGPATATVVLGGDTDIALGVTEPDTMAWSMMSAAVPEGIATLTAVNAVDINRPTKERRMKDPFGL